MRGGNNEMETQNAVYNEGGSDLYGYGNSNESLANFGVHGGLSETQIGPINLGSFNKTPFNKDGQNWSGRCAW